MLIVAYCCCQPSEVWFQLSYQTAILSFCGWLLDKYNWISRYASPVGLIMALLFTVGKQYVCINPFYCMCPTISWSRIRCSLNILSAWRFKYILTYLPHTIELHNYLSITHFCVFPYNCWQPAANVSLKLTGSICAALLWRFASALHQ